MVHDCSTQFDLHGLQKGLCGSLLLSMLQQMMQEDKLDEVKAAAVRSLAILVAFIDDRQKFTQVNECTFSETFILHNICKLHFTSILVTPSTNYNQINLIINLVLYYLNAAMLCSLLIKLNFL